MRLRTERIGVAHKPQDRITAGAGEVFRRPSELPQGLQQVQIKRHRIFFVPIGKTFAHNPLPHIGRHKIPQGLRDPRQATRRLAEHRQFLPVGDLQPSIAGFMPAPGPWDGPRRDRITGVLAGYDRKAANRRCGGHRRAGPILNSAAAIQCFKSTSLDRLEGLHGMSGAQPQPVQTLGTSQVRFERVLQEIAVVTACHDGFEGMAKFRVELTQGDRRLVENNDR